MKNATVEIVTVIDNKVLTLNYNCRTDHVRFSVADDGGNVVMRGTYDCIVDRKIEITDLSAGIYMLCIIDGDTLTKARFRKV